MRIAFLDVPKAVTWELLGVVYGVVTHWVGFFVVVPGWWFWMAAGGMDDEIQTVMLLKGSRKSGKVFVEGKVEGVENLVGVFLTCVF